ncbi:MAG: hypothetical protein JJ975_00040 [Bacteroidia bacterium]|nr:hypothetical protein [Bacteroidia bacterium]
MNNLEHLLSNYSREKHSFPPDFTDGVMSSIGSLSDSSRIIRLWQKRMFTAVAACLVCVLMSVYVLDGSLSFDSFLGLSEHSSTEISQSIETYSQWDLEVE